ncbi:MAG: prepilin peptidase [Syntrophomonadaceae bacterium]
MLYLLLGLLVAASIYDFKYRRIPNWLTGMGMLTALLLHLFYGGWGEVLFSLKGLAVGIALLLVPFALRGIGAGDVKLLGVVGAFQGVNFVFSTFLWMALWGGLMALIFAYRNGKLGQVVLNLFPGAVKYALPLMARIDTERSEQVVYPYALAIALGVVCTFLKGWC